MDANIDLQEILRNGAEQKRLWDEYEGDDKSGWIIIIIFS